MIEKGRVRLTFPDIAKYNLKSCSDFGNPSPALINRDFWTDEFLEGIDGETVLVVQGDSCLCRLLDVERWRPYAFVGAVWPKEPSSFCQGNCLEMSVSWKVWTLNQRRWEQQQLKPPPKSRSGARPEPVAKLASTRFPALCRDATTVPVGNGGFSMRNRTWMVKAIESCPHVRYSGLAIQESQQACQVMEDLNEDFYFGTVLRGIGAPLPGGREASVFSTEMLLPQNVETIYGPFEEPVETSDLEETRIMFKGTPLDIPTAFHKPWWYLPNSLLRSREVKEKCPFLEFIHHPDESRWDRFREEAHWMDNIIAS